MNAPSPLPSLNGFVELRRRLLRAELEAASLVGRTDDVGKIKAEMRFLEISPGDAMMVRVAHGRLVAGGQTASPANFESQVNVVRRRLVELDTEVAQWRATRAARHTR